MPVASLPGVSFTPSATLVPTPENYLGSADFDWLKQYAPAVYTKIHDRYGSQDITGLLEQLGSEMPADSDSILWKEENRLTQLGSGVALSGNVFTLASHTFRPSETIVVRNADGSILRQGRIESTTTNTFTAKCGHASGWSALGSTGLTVFVSANEYKKKTAGMETSVNTTFESFENNFAIIKEMVDESGSNMAQKVWLEVTDDNGNVLGNVWFYENYKNTEKRFKNAIESKLIRDRKWAGDLASDGYQGSEGLIQAMEGGNIFNGSITDMLDVDQVIDRMQKQGALAQNYLYNTTAFGLGIDDFLKAEHVTGLSWGAFNNDENMALNLEFKGFHRGGFEFYKSRSSYLNNTIGEGSVLGVNKINAFMIPSGSKSIYNVQKGKVATQPVLHVRYRANGATNRKYQMAKRSWEQGTTAGVDEQRMEFQTERALILLGRANTMEFVG
jgi:hypothetical protein